MDKLLENDQENNHSMMKRNSQKRKQSYRNLLNRVEAIQETDDVGINTVTELGAVLREANSLDNDWKIEERIEHADETLLDCLVLSSTSTVLKTCIEAVDVFTSTYEQSEFTDKIIRSIKDEECEELEPSHLLKLLEDARSIIPQVPEYNYLYGTYDLNQVPQPKPKKERQKVVKEKLQKKEPEKITSLDKEEAGIEEIVKFFYEVLLTKYNENDQEPIGYYDYVIDTEDFAITVENIFYFSFLVRDGRAQIDLNGKGEPIVKPIKKNYLKAFREEGGINSQIITCINMDQWKRYKKQGYIQQHRKKKS